jgi:hypothetical protein
MYSTNAPKSVGPTENAAYPHCHAKSGIPFVFNHREDALFNSSTISATLFVRDNRIARCT